MTTVLKNNINIGGFLKFFLFFIKRTFTFYLIVFLIFNYMLNYKEVNKFAKVETLNRIRPKSFSYFSQLANNPANVNKNKISQYISYFAYVVEMIPGRADAHVALAYCYYYLGKNKKAIDSFQDSINLFPEHFWSYYNIGFILFKENKHDEAIKYFEAAMETDIEQTIEYQLSSHVFLPILSDSKVNNVPMMLVRIKKAIRNSFLYLIISYKNLKNYKAMLVYSLNAIKSELDKKEEFLYYAAEASFLKKDYKRSMYFVVKALKINESFSEAHALIGKIYQESGQSVKSRRYEENAAFYFKEKGSALTDMEKINLQLF